ncbi:TatD DNase family protein [Hypnocyclicus thermotrophus]|uniref:TatD DNase family protein n=1 Tax=Hypnocyclicus thermotrophus TaxID=1627895 RepID=A0AA46DYV2_9FUSO|nr:TatD family hydrolase [Hypnocyclicus thermotrophus]TDT70587.1 TatD DNase family protein [Hypnocyclicus thermotrophus]
MKLVDTHCHIYGEKYKNDIEEVLAEAKKELEFIVNIGYDLESSKISVDIANKYDFVYATVGFHPTDISKMNEESLKQIYEIAKKNNKVLAIGEIGLDYYWMKDEVEKQKIAFLKQLELAEEINKPVVIHTREAMKDTIDILKSKKNITGIIHCYPGSYETAKSVIDRFYFGINGVVTFKNNKKTQEVVKKIPLERLVIETDAPYLTPTPFRGKRNKPTYVKYVAEKIAELKNISIDEVIKVTTNNAKKIYRIED